MAIKLKREEIISLFFEKLSERCEYAILHHIDRVYETSNDIDFVVKLRKKDMLKFVIDFASEKNLFINNYFLVDIDIYRFDLIYYQNDKFERIDLDCACNSSGKDALKIDTYALLKNKMLIDINGSKFYKVSDNDEIDYYIKKKAYKNSDISLYISYFQALDNNYFSNDIQEKYIKWKIYFQSKQYKFNFLKNKFVLLLKRIPEKSALTICFLGPDGSGKSTIIHKINEQPLFIYNYYFHLKPLMKDPSKVDKIIMDPHRFEPYSKLKSYMKLLYLVFVFNYGWFKNILKLKIKPSLIIFDRYFDDMLVDFKRYRYGGSVNIAKIARYFIPKPDLYFILTTDADIIYKRKQEVPFKELERQIEGYRALADGKYYFNIDVNKTPTEISYEIVQIMMEKMNERY